LSDPKTGSVVADQSESADNKTSEASKTDLSDPNKGSVIADQDEPKTTEASATTTQQVSDDDLISTALFDLNEQEIAAIQAMEDAAEAAAAQNNN